MFGGSAFGSTPFAGVSGRASLLATLTATISVGAEAGLTTTARLTTAPATIAISTTASLTVKVDLRGATGISFSTAATLSSPYGVTITIGGVNVTGRVRRSGLTIRDVLNDAPNTASLTLEGDPPALGQAIRMVLGSAPGRVLFAGSIQTIDQSYESLPQHVAWALTAIDDTGRANQKRPLGTWHNYPADVIADWMTRNYTALSPAGIAPGLPTTTIIFDGSETFIAALARLATQIGGYCKVEDGTVYLFLEDTTDPPDPIDVSHPPLNTPPVTITVDSSQLRTRVYGKGYGETIRADLPVNATLIPIQDGVGFPPTGGEAMAGTMPEEAQALKLRYTGVALQGGGTLVGPGAAPGVAPAVMLAGGSGVTTGTHTISLVFVTANGRTLPSPPASIDVGALAGPPTALVAGTPLPGSGPDEGYHDYLVTYVTAYGETASGALSNYVYCSAAVGQLAPPAAPGAGAATAGLGPDPGSHQYSVTFVNSEGETTGSSPSNAVSTSSSGGELAAPPYGPTPGAPQLGAGVDSGGHAYSVTFVNANGETPAGPQGPLVTTYFGGELAVPNPPQANPPTQGAGVTDGTHDYSVTFVNQYGETTSGNGSNTITTGPQLVGQTSPVPPNMNSPSGLTAAYGGALNLNGGQRYYYRLTFTTATGESLPGNYGDRTLSSNVTPPNNFDAGNLTGTTATGGTLSAGTTYYYQQTFATSQGESLPSPVASRMLTGAQNAMNVSWVGTGDSRVTQKKLYRSTSPTSGFSLIVTGAYNASPYLDKGGQGGGGSPPTADTTHETAMNLSIATSPDGRVTGRKLYRSIAGDTDARHLLTTITNNTQTTWNDIVADATIVNAPPPPTQDSTANPGTMQPFNVVPIINIPIGPAGVTARKLYRRPTWDSTRKLVATLNDNITTAYTDTMPDANRGPVMPATNTTGTYYQRVPITGIPIGPAGVTARKLYRNNALVAQISGNTTTVYTDSTPNNALGPAPPTSNSTGEPYRTVPVSSIAIGPAGTTSRRLYRQFNGAGTFKLVTSLTNNTATIFTDTKANSALGADRPLTNTTGIAVQKVPLSEIPIGPLGVTARKIYRKFNFSNTAQLVTTLANNTATTFTDQVPNNALGAVYTGVNTAVGNQITAITIPVGAQAVTAREFYMSPAGGGPRKLALTVPDNTTREATITASDAILAGAAAEPINDTSGLQQPVGQVNPGATAIPLAAATTFRPSGGYVILAGGQTVFYSGISGQTLIGVPASGPGAITTTILYGSQALPAPMLLGVTGVALPLLKGSAVHIWVQRDDLQAQAEERARAGGDGIIEYLITDQRRGQDSLIERCEADLALFARPIITVGYACRDLKTKSGKPITLTLPGFTLGDPLVIQEVTITEIDAAANLPPRFTVRASNVRFSLEDVLRRMIAAENKGLR
jgi:hypothetical protein